jgi:hypothetical protein
LLLRTKEKERERGNKKNAGKYEKQKDIAR